MPERLTGLTPEQRDELQAMLGQLSRLWADLTEAAAREDADRVTAIQQEIATCRRRVDEIKRSGTLGSA